MNIVIQWKDHSPRTFLNKVIYESIPKKKKGKKVKDSDFIIPKMDEYNKLIENNYNVKQLKLMCKNYKLKVSGNKEEKIHRVYNYLKYSFYAIKVQRIFRGYLIKKLKKLKGIDLMKNSVNDTDFLTFQEIKKIPFDQLFCFKEDDGFVYTFDVYSIFNLIMKEKKNIAKNPYNRQKLNPRVIFKLNKIIWITQKVLKRKINYKFQKDTNVLTPIQKLEMRTIEMFQKIDQLDYITDTKWLLNLSKIRLIRFIRELQDVWNYRAQISDEIKIQISPPLGKPFSGVPLDTLMHKSSITLLGYCLDIMKKMLCSEDKDSRTLGANYILGALTIVSQSAANSLPWLYSSFMPNQ